MGDYKETVERTLNDLRRAEKYCLNDYSRMAGNAANLIENILTENAALRRTIDNLTSAQAVVLKEFEAKLEELAEVKAERDAAADDIRKMLTGEFGCMCEFCANYENQMPDA